MFSGANCMQIIKKGSSNKTLKPLPFNKGKSKVYVGVAGNLVAYACRIQDQNRFIFLIFHLF